MSSENTTTDSEASFIDRFNTDNTAFTPRFDDIAGMEDTKEKLQQTFISNLQAGIPNIIPPALLLYGPSGTGKLRIAKAIAGELTDQGFQGTIVSPKAVRQFMKNAGQEPEQIIVDILEYFKDNQPRILVVDQIEEFRIEPNGKLVQIFSQIRQAGDQVACIMIADDPRLLFRRQHQESCFDIADIVVEIPSPDKQRRTHMLEDAVTQAIAGTALEIDEEVQFEGLAATTNSWKRETFQSIGRRAAQLTIASNKQQTVVTQHTLQTAIEQIQDELPEIEDQDQWSNTDTDLSKRFTATIPDTQFDDIGGLDEQIDRLQELLRYPDEFADVYTETNLDRGHGVLLHGPPGTGKTLLAKAIAHHSDRNFYAVKGPEVKSKWFGETEHQIRALFDSATETAPSLIFFDEIDAIAGVRSGYNHSVMSSVVNTLLTEMDGLDSRDDILVIAVTNRPEVLDEALLRPGRIDERIHCPPPDQSGQAAIFDIHTTKAPTESTVSAEWFADIVPTGVTGAEIRAICEEALRTAMRAVDNDDRNDVSIHKCDVKKAIGSVVDRQIGEAGHKPAFQ